MQQAIYFNDNLPVNRGGSFQQTQNDVFQTISMHAAQPLHRSHFALFARAKLFVPLNVSPVIYAPAARFQIMKQLISAGVGSLCKKLEESRSFSPWRDVQLAF
jgi:hypothetical protein